MVEKKEMDGKEEDSEREGESERESRIFFRTIEFYENRKNYVSVFVRGFSISFFFFMSKKVSLLLPHPQVGVGNSELCVTF